MAKDTRGATLYRLRTECGFRAGIWRFTATIAKVVQLGFISHKISGDEQIASSLQTQIGHRQIASDYEVNRAGNVLHPGGLARIH